MFGGYNVSINSEYPQGQHKLYIQEQSGQGALRIVADPSLFSSSDIFNIDINGSYESLFAVGRTGKVRIKYDGGSLLYRDSQLLVTGTSSALDGCLTLDGKYYNVLLTGVSGDNAESIRIDNDGSITNNGVYGTWSDLRLKENIVPATSKLDDLLKVNIVNYNLIKDNSKLKQIGVVAQELEEIFPGLVSDDKDGIKSVKYSIFVPILV